MFDQLISSFFAPFFSNFGSEPFMKLNKNERDGSKGLMNLTQRLASLAKMQILSFPMYVVSSTRK